MSECHPMMCYSGGFEYVVSFLDFKPDSSKVLDWNHLAFVAKPIPYPGNWGCCAFKDLSFVHGLMVNGHLIAESSEGRGKSVSSPYSLQSLPLDEATDAAWLGARPFPFDVSAAMFVLYVQKLDLMSLDR